MNLEFEHSMISNILLPTHNFVLKTHRRKNKKNKNTQKGISWWFSG